MPLSDYWRIRRSRMPDIEAVYVKRSAETMVSALGEEANVVWDPPEGSQHHFSFKSANNRGSDIGLNLLPIVQAPENPIPGDSVDAIIGHVMHEVGHKRVQSAKTAELLKKYQPFRQEGMLEFADVLEDYLVDREVAKSTVVGGQYILAARKEAAVDVKEFLPDVMKVINDHTLPPEIRVRGATALFNLAFNYNVKPQPGDFIQPEVYQAVKGIVEAAKKLDSRPQIRQAQISKAWRELCAVIGEPPEEQETQPQPAASMENINGMQSALATLEGAGEEGLSKEEIDALGSLTRSAQDAEENAAEDLEGEMEKVFGAGGVEDELFRLFNAEEDPEFLTRSIELNAEPTKAELSGVFEVFREVHTRKFRGMKEGKISRTRLWRAGADRDDLFEKRQMNDEVGLSVCLLLDHSGSVTGMWSRFIEPLGVGLAGSRNRNVEIMVLAYSTSDKPVANKSGSARAYRSDVAVLYRNGWQAWRSAYSALAFGGTPSAVGLVAAGTILERSRKSNKLVLHVTDGDPGNVGRVAGLEACRLATESLQQRRIESVCVMVGIDGAKLDAERRHDFESSYGRFITARDIGEVAPLLQELLKEKAIEILGHRG